MIKKEIIKKRIEIFIEIFLIITAIFASSYLLGDALNDINTINVTEEPQDISFASKILELFGRIIFNEKGIVSAQTVDDIVYTCIKAKDGSVCQEYYYNECNEKCEEGCIPTSRDKVNECKIGTCIDKFEGICARESPKEECELRGGKWDPNPETSIAACKPGCCVAGDNTLFGTKRQCERIY